MNTQQHSSGMTAQAIAAELIDLMDTIDLAEKLLVAVSCLASTGTSEMIDAVNSAALSELRSGRADLEGLREKLLGARK